MIYILYIIFIVLFCNLGDKNRGGGLLFRIMPLLLFVSLVGFRSYTVGVDSESYMELYYAIPYQNYRWIEPGFDWLVRFLFDLGCSYNALFLVCIILTAIPMFFVLEDTDYYSFSASFFYIFSLLIVTNGIRQCIAVGAFMLACYFIKKQKLLYFALCMAFALLFHYSSIILFPLYFFINGHLKQRIYMLIYLVSFVFVFVNPGVFVNSIASLIPFIGENYQIGDSAYDLGSLSLFGFLYTTFINVLMFVLLVKTNQFEKNPILSNCSFICIVLKNFSMNLPIIGRLSLYFQWFPYLLLPILIGDYCHENKNIERLYKIGFIFLYSVIFIHNMIGHTMKMTPYLYNFTIFE